MPRTLRTLLMRDRCQLEREWEHGLLGVFTRPFPRQHESAVPADGSVSGDSLRDRNSTAYGAAMYPPPSGNRAHCRSSPRARRHVVLGPVPVLSLSNCVAHGVAGNGTCR